ncbi:hypothetical protein ELQ35_20475 [Peribacillus cavernae]|uniref:Uncharacterized protein n=1 Tax=Peribacillus cavernae TaxID=1674310 RepID=A0A433HAD0_9BACI|nr:hypothetical protein [Peribacillus cavernae]MDQ0219739.1 hypothetical protein [Peribacillus cavernae]RUQ25203.1 hypothetical protein ELQ35_20475 [Peribacillus cavernae]
MKEASVLQHFKYNPEVKLLLKNYSDKKEEMVYMNHCWPMPKIGPRPPYYCNPQYVKNYPLI